MRESPKKQPGELEPDYIWEKRSQNQKSMMKPKKQNTRKNVYDMHKLYSTVKYCRAYNIQWIRKISRVNIIMCMWFIIFMFFSYVHISSHLCVSRALSRCQLFCIYPTVTWHIQYMKKKRIVHIYIAYYRYTTT